MSKESASSPPQDVDESVALRVPSGDGATYVHTWGRILTQSSLTSLHRWEGRKEYLPAVVAVVVAAVGAVELVVAVVAMEAVVAVEAARCLAPGWPRPPVRSYPPRDRRCKTPWRACNCLRRHPPAWSWPMRLC